MSNNIRYYRRPLVRFLELYVLWSIGELDARYDEVLERATPKLEETYNIRGDWITIISTVMEFPPNMPELIREKWKQFLEIALSRGDDMSPQRFAEIFVDNNFNIDPAG